MLLLMALFHSLFGWVIFFYLFSLSFHCQWAFTLLPCLEGEGEVAQLCLTLCDPVDCSLPGSSVQGILQARILEWVAISFSRGSSWPRDRTQVSRIGGRHFNLWATREHLLTFGWIKGPCVMATDLCSLDVFSYLPGPHLFPTHILDCFRFPNAIPKLKSEYYL